MHTWLKSAGLSLQLAVSSATSRNRNKAKNIVMKIPFQEQSNAAPTAKAISGLKNFKVCNLQNN